MNVDHVKQGNITTSAGLDVYSVKAQAAMKIGFDVAPLAQPEGLDSSLAVYNSNGAIVASGIHALAGNGVAVPDTSLVYTFPSSGTYYLSVAGTNGTTGGYLLYTAGIGGTGFAGFSFSAYRSSTLSTPVTISRFNGSTQAIDPAVRTWIVVHGYQGNGHTSGISKLATEIQSQYPGDQVLTLDWSKAASDPSYTDTQQWLPAIGTAAAQALARHGYAPGTINLVGYSFGTYISDAMAAKLPGGANTMLAVDPPEYLPGGGAYNPEVSVNFSAHSHYSIAFHDADAGTSLGDNLTPTTATISIDVTGTSHGAMIGLVGSLYGSGDPVSQQFRFSNLLDYSPGPWASNRLSATGQMTGGGYEALITTTSAGTKPLLLKYFSSLTGQPVTINA